jgi:hypothetical protein
MSRDDLRYKVTSPSGEVTEKDRAENPMTSAFDVVDVALDAAIRAEPGSIIELRLWNGREDSRARDRVWRYHTGRFAGLPSIRNINEEPDERTE